MERKEKLSIYNAYDCWHIVPRESKHGALDTILQTYRDVRLNDLKLISMESNEK